MSQGERYVLYIRRHVRVGRANIYLTATVPFDFTQDVDAVQRLDVGGRSVPPNRFAAIGHFCPSLALSYHERQEESCVIRFASAAANLVSEKVSPG